MDRLLIENGRFLTADDTFTPGHLLVTGGRVDGFVLDADRKDLKAGGAQVVAGGYVIPGFVDAHYHLHGRAVRSARCDLSRARSVQDLAQMLVGWIPDCDEEIVVGVDWDESAWQQPTWPTRQFIDEAVTDRPVFLRRVCCHQGVGNTRFLELLARHAPSSGPSVDSSTGVIREPATTVATRLSYPPADRVAVGIRRAVAEAHRLGITTIHDIVQETHFAEYLDGIAHADRPLRIDAYFHCAPTRYPTLVEQAEAAGVRHFQPVGVKFWLDGTLEGGTAALEQDYADRPGRGELHLTAAELTRAIATCGDVGCGCAIHVVGDRALRVACHVLGNNEHRTWVRLEHCVLTSPNGLDALAATGVALAMQPNYTRRWGHRDGPYHDRLGPERWRYCNRFRAIGNAGIPFALSSDCMPPGPLYGIEGAIHHANVDERIDVTEALARYTRTAATLGPHTRQAGQLEKGYLADLTILSHNPLSDGADLNRIRVLRTIVDGRVVYDGGVAARSRAAKG